MKQITLIIRDVSLTIHGEMPGDLADRVIASLSAEPETIAELETAIGRFISLDSNNRPLALFRDGFPRAEPTSTTLILDLAAHVVAGESSYSIEDRLGELRFPDPHASEEVRIIYRVPPEWLFVKSAVEYEACRTSRIEERLQDQPVRRLDARQTLYGLEMTSFLVRECQAAHQAGEEYPIPDIHARWLMTPRTDLAGQTPREVMMARRDFIDFDLHTRQLQWSFLLEGPPGLSRESFAYRFAGFGTHEIVLYYELIRVLLGACWERLQAGESFDSGAEGQRLKDLADDWLEHPQYDEGGMIPAAIIESERRRIPLIVSPQEAMIDEDCDWCRMMADEETFGPTFRHLDGCNMDNEFVFSLYDTLEEWEEEQRRFEEYSAKYERERTDSDSQTGDSSLLGDDDDDGIPF